MQNAVGVLLPAGSETSFSSNVVSAGLEESVQMARFGVQSCQGQGRCRLEQQDQEKLFSASAHLPSSAVDRSQDSDDVLVLVDSEDDDDEGNGEENTMGSSIKQEAMALVNGNSIQAAYLNCPTEGEPWCLPAGWVWGLEQQREGKTVLWFVDSC